MSEHGSLNEGQGVSEVRRAVTSTAVTPAAADTSELGRISELLRLASPVTKTLAERAQKKAATDAATEAGNLAKTHRASMPDPKDLESMQIWRKRLTTSMLC